MGAQFLSPVSPCTDLQFVSAKGSAFGYTARKDDLGVSSPGFLPWSTSGRKQGSGLSRVPEKVEARNLAFLLERDAAASGSRRKDGV